MFMGFMAENSVQFRDSGFKVGFEDVDKGVVGLRAQRIVVRLGGDTEADLPGCAPVAAAGAFDAQRLGGEDGNRAVDAGIEPRIEKKGAFEDHVVALLLFGPRREIGPDGRVDDGVQVGEGLRLGEDPPGKVGTVQGPVRIGFGPETVRDAPAQLRILRHQPFGPGIGVIDRDAQTREKTANGAFAAADAACDSDLHHGLRGTSISGMSPMEMILMSLNRGARAFCSDWGR